MKQTTELLYHKMLNQDLKSNENYSTVFFNITNRWNKIVFKVFLLQFYYVKVSTLSLFYSEYCRVYVHTYRYVSRVHPYNFIHIYTYHIYALHVQFLLTTSISLDLETGKKNKDDKRDEWMRTQEIKDESIGLWRSWKGFKKGI